MTHKELMKAVVKLAQDSGWTAGGGGKPSQITITFRKIGQSLLGGERDVGT